MLRVFVYYNLHKHCWSVKALEGPNKGRVVAHRDVVWLDNAQFRVSEAGRQRVLREQRKNVHAGVVGYWSDYQGQAPWLCEDDRITYNPYKYSQFVTQLTKVPVRSADKVYMTGRAVYNIQPSQEVSHEISI